MKKYLKLLPALLLVFAGMSAIAQTSSPHQLPSILPPSPNAAELGKYGGIPINLSTGAVNYSIPLLSLTSGTLKAGIALAYNAGGIKLDQIASRAGLGWVLNAGGMVNRTVHGNPDEDSGVAPVPPSFSGNDTATVNFLDRATLNKDSYDTEPDIFSFNFNGYTGRFVLNPTDKTKVIFFEKSNLKIEMDFTAEFGKVNITDANGIKYYFGGGSATEISRSGNSGSGCGRTYDTGVQTAWYLNKIKDLNGDSIVFSYQPIEITYETAGSQTNLVQDVATRSMSLYDTGTGVYLYPQGDSQTSCVSFIINDGVYLDKIVTSRGEQIQFSYITRSDIANELLFSKLEYGLVSATPLKTINFTYSQVQSPSGYYSGSSSPENLYRPYLVQVKENSKGLSDFKTSQFHYYHAADLPQRLSYSQDEYGFFNGTHNQGFLPAYSVGGLFSYTPADRSTDGDYANYGMLSKVIYPTTGSDSIVYEPHNTSSVVVGGARVKQVITHDSFTGKNTIKSYMYKIYPSLTISSGLLLRQPRGHFSPVNMQLKSSVGDIIDPTYTLASSGGNSTLYAESGSHIAYTNVIENDSTDFSNGGILHQFTLNLDDYPTVERGVEFPNMPFGVSGLPSTSEYYQMVFRIGAESAKIKLKEVFTHVKSLKTDSLQGYLGRKNYDDLFFRGQPYDLVSYPLGFYWNYVDSSKVITYDLDGLNPVTELTENFYDNSTHLQLTRTRTTGSDGRLVTKQMSYPNDMVSTSQDPTGVYAGMVAVHKIAPLIEEQVTLPSSVVVTKVKTNYYQFYTGLFMPQTVDEYDAINSSYQTRLRFLNYDTKGNILSVANENAPKITYIWSFKNTLPVAELKNVDYTTFVSTIGSTAISNFSNLTNPDKPTIDAFIATVKTAFPNALITAYSYILGVGVNSVTDAKGLTIYYEYDDFQRLRFIKDEDGNILKSMDYNYAHTPVYNTARSQAFTRNNCAVGSIGSAVTYTVPANTYSASTLAGANALADADIAANGQNYANTNGTCTANVNVTLDVDVSPTNTFSINFHNTGTSVDYTYSRSNSYTTVSIPQGTYIVTVVGTDPGNVTFYTATIFGQDILFRKAIVAEWDPTAMTGSYTLTIR